MEVRIDPAPDPIDALVPLDAVDPEQERISAESVLPTTRLDALLRLPLGLTILVAERVRADLGPDLRAAGTGAAFLVGLGDAAATAAGRAARALMRAGQRPARMAAGLAERGLKSSPPVLARPARQLQTVAANRFEVTILRGREISTLARAEAVAFLNAESASGIAWVRQQVLPTMIDDLAADPKIRELALGQAQGAFADAARELRQRSAVADGWVEAGVRRLLGRHEPAPTPARSQPADG